MKIKIQSLLMAASLSLFLLACKKDSNNSKGAPSNADLQTQSDDENRVSNETDAAFDDVNTSMNGQASVTGTSEAAPIRYGVAVQGGTAHDTVKSLICDAVVTIDTIDATRNLTITYNGGNCQLTRTRTGSIVVSWAKGAQWAIAGTSFTVTFNNLKITRVLDGKSITLNGTHTYTNVSGGNIFSLNANSTKPIVHTISSSNMSITFDNGATRTWSVARQRVYKYANSVLTVTISGLHTDGSTTGISEWGTNRFGNNFSTVIAQPVVFSSGCVYRVISGQVILNNALGSTTITFGLDSTGIATGCPVAGAYFYFKLVWAGVNGKVYTVIMPY